MFRVPFFQIPPPTGAQLLETVVSVRLRSAPLAFRMPPPATSPLCWMFPPPAVLPDTMQLISVSVAPPALKIPPPPRPWFLVELLLITASRRVSVPALKIPPPLFSTDPALVPPPLPPVTVTPEIETITPDPTVNARSMTVLLLASIVTLDALGPAMVRCVLIVRLPLVRLMTAG